MNVCCVFKTKIMPFMLHLSSTVKAQNVLCPLQNLHMLEIVLPGKTCK